MFIYTGNTADLAQDSTKSAINKDVRNPGSFIRFQILLHS